VDGKYVERDRVEPSGADDAEFGISVSAEGDLVAVGARGYKDDGGGIFLYRRVGAKLRAGDILHLPQSGFWTSYRIGLAAGRAVAGSRAGTSAFWAYENGKWTGQTLPTSGSSVAITTTAVALAHNDSKNVTIFSLPAPGALPPGSEGRAPVACDPGCDDGEACVDGACVADEPAGPGMGGAGGVAPPQGGAGGMAGGSAGEGGGAGETAGDGDRGGAGGDALAAGEAGRGGAGGGAEGDEGAGGRGDDDAGDDGGAGGCSMGGGPRGGAWALVAALGLVLRRRRRRGAGLGARSAHEGSRSRGGGHGRLGAGTPWVSVVAA